MLIHQILAYLKKSHKIVIKSKKRKSFKNNKFKISSPEWNEEFELPDGSYSISDIQNYFEYNIKRHKKVDGNFLCKFIAVIKNRF